LNQWAIGIKLKRKEKVGESGDVIEEGKSTTITTIKKWIDYQESSGVF